MLLRFLKSRLFIFLSVLFFICFLIGYDYAVLTSKDQAAAEVRAPVATAGTEDNSSDPFVE